MSDITGNAFITTRKGFYYLTIKIGRENHHMMKVRQYKIEPDEKRQMRRLYPNVTFDWKKITDQLAKKREVCRSYRSRRQDAAVLKRERRYRRREPFIGVIDPLRRAVYVNDERNIAGAAALLDALIAMERQ
jgi:hypothetical protein